VSEPTTAWPVGVVEPRRRVISDNDYCGDPDGLVQLAHQFLCPSVDLRLVVGGQVPTYDAAWSPSCAEDSAAEARRIAELAGRQDVPIVAGSSEAMDDPAQPRRAAAPEAIVAEAMRDDTTVPLVVACGGSLTNIASSWLMEPRISERLTLVWIGGEYDDLAPPPSGGLGFEYNTSIDTVAAQVVFNESDLDLWQVPRSTYTQVIASRSEMLARMRPLGPLGEHLFDAIGRMAERMRSSWGMHLGETYVLGDSPLVLLTALLSSFEATPSSCRWVVRPRPHLLESGHYDTSVEGRAVRVFTQLDSRLLLEDLYAKLALHAATGSIMLPADGGGLS
jgi:purine nucleosidase